MSQSPWKRWGVRSFIAVGAAVLMAGCASRGSAQGTKANYVALFASGQYQQAYEESSRVASSLRSSEKSRAGLIAGLSAQALDRNSDATHYLTPLVRDADVEVSGKASAALGLIALEQREHERAAELLSGASEKLLRDDRARAAMYAGDAYRALGKSNEAKGMYLRAQQSITAEGALSGLVSERLAALEQAAPKPIERPSTRESVPREQAKVEGPATSSPAPNGASGTVLSTVQVGTFATWKGAMARMSDLKRHGAARIVESRDSFGRRLYAVRVGVFASGTEAADLASRIGLDASVMPMEGR